MINTASTAALRATSIGIYGVTKAAYVMLTQVMARSGTVGIRVNAVCAGVNQDAAQ